MKSTASLGEVGRAAIRKIRKPEDQPMRPYVGSSRFGSLATVMENGVPGKENPGDFLFWCAISCSVLPTFRPV